MSEVQIGSGASQHEGSLEVWELSVDPQRQEVHLNGQMQEARQKGEMMHGGKVTVQQTSKGMVVVTVHHPDGDLLGASLSFVEAKALMESIEHELTKKFNKFNPRTKRTRGRTAEKHT